MSTKLPPVPQRAPMLDSSSILTAVWADWFKQAFVRIGENFALSNLELATSVNNITTAKIVDSAVSFVKLLASDWTRSLSASGYQKLPSGLYIQWGSTGSLGSASNTTVSFPTSFPSSCFQVMAGITANSGGAVGATGHWGTGNYTASGFDLYNRTSAAYAFNWMAVGK